jgi:hypothetical protein
MDKGYIYILVNPSMQGLVKIGKSMRNPEERARELSSGTNVPFSFEVGYEKLVSNCDLAERLIHQKLSLHRAANNREFFAISLREAINAVNKILLDNKLSLNEPEVWDYQFNGKTYADFGLLLKAFVQDSASWKDALIHIERKYLEKWFENKRNYDYLILMEKTNSKFPEEKDKVLIYLLYKVNPDFDFQLFGKKINQANLNLLYENRHNNNRSQNEIFIYNLLNEGRIQEYYEIYKNLTLNSDKTLELFFTLYSKKFNPLEIKRIIHWNHNNQDYYINHYNSHLDYNEIRFLLTKKEINDLVSKYYISIDILNKLRSEDKSVFFEIHKDFHPYISEYFSPFEIKDRFGGRLFQKDIDYWFLLKHFDKICQLTSSEYFELDNLGINRISGYLNNYLFPESLREGLNSENFEVFLFSVYFFCNRGKAVEKYAESKNPQILKIISDYGNYSKNLIDHMTDLRRFSIYDFDMEGLFVPFLRSQILKTRNYASDYKRLYGFMFDLFSQPCNEGVVLIEKEKLKEFKEFSNDYLQPKTIDNVFFENDSLNFAAWFLGEFKSQRAIRLDEIEDLLIPDCLRKKLVQKSLSYSQYKQISEKIFWFFSKEYFKQILVPKFIKSKILSEDLNVFIEGVSDLFKLSNKKAIVNKKSLVHLNENHFFPFDLENQLLNSDENEYKKIIEFFVKKGYVFYDSFLLFIFQNRNNPSETVFINNLNSPLFGDQIIFKDEYDRSSSISQNFKDLDWERNWAGKYYIATIHLVNKAKSWCVINSAKFNKKSFIDPSDINSYAFSYGKKVMEDVINRYSDFESYELLKKIIDRRIVPEKLDEFKKCIEKLFAVSSQKHTSFINGLLSYHDGFYQEFGEIEFSYNDIRFINNSIDIINSPIERVIDKVFGGWRVYRIKRFANEFGIVIK